MAEEREDPNNPRLSVLQFIAQLGEGSTIQDLQGALAEASKAVELTGKKAKITLEINMACCTTAQKAVVIAAEVKSKVPKLPPLGRVLYVDSEGGLRHHDTKQNQLDLKPRAVAPVAGRDFDASTGEVRAN